MLCGMDDAGATRHFKTSDGRNAILRGATLDDAATFCAFLPQSHTETDFLNYMPGEFRKTVEEEEEFLREKLLRDDALALVVEVDERMAACGGAWKQECKRFAHHAELGLTVLQEFWGQGIGRRLMEAIVDWGRRQGLHKIYLKVHADNDRAIQLYQSMGFVEEGRLKDDVARRTGGYCDTIVMAKYYADRS